MVFFRISLDLFHRLMTGDRHYLVRRTSDFRLSAINFRMKPYFALLSVSTVFAKDCPRHEAGGSENLSVLREETQ